MLLRIKVQDITTTEGGGGTEIMKIICCLTMLWILHWFISRSGVVLGLEVDVWKFGMRLSLILNNCFSACVSNPQ